MRYISRLRPGAVWLLAALTLVGCTKRETREPSSTASGRSTTTTNSTTVIGGEWDASVPESSIPEYDSDRLEQGRRDSSWIVAARLDLERMRQGARAVPARSGDAESLMTQRSPSSRQPGGAGAAAAAARGAGQTARPGGVPGPIDLGPQIPGLERLWIGQGADSLPVVTLQVWLDRVDFSPGVIDGSWGKNTAKALYWFQESYGLNPTGNLDPATLEVLGRLNGNWEPLVDYTVSAEDVKGPFTPLPGDVYRKAKLSCLCYENALEAIGEKFHTTPEFLRALNGGRNLESPAAGTAIRVPHIDAGDRGATSAPIARIIISKRGFYTHAVDAEGNIIYHFPSTLGSKYDPSPEGNLKITGIAFKPPFHYQPKLFSEVPDTEPEAHLPPGPNSPVGLVWMQLSKANYGIHGTATPETIGYESSHGCIRLANWDALLLAHHVKPGVPVEFTESAQAALGREPAGQAGGR